MPRTGVLLSDAERVAFGRWLQEQLDRAGVSKSEIARKLVVCADPKHEASTQAVKRYLGEGAPIPGPKVLAKIAAAIGIPWPIAFWQAGYFRELLVVIDRIADQLDAAIVDLGSGDLNSRHKVPALLALCATKSAMVAFALRAFPRRDVETRPTLDDSLDERDIVVRSLGALSFDEVFAPGISRSLHPLLERAADALLERAAPVDVRRFVAGEYVNAWADAYVPGFTNARRVDFLHEADTAQRKTLSIARQILRDYDDKKKGK